MENEDVITDEQVEYIPPRAESIPGGNAFVEKMVRDIVNWAYRVESPAFIIGTEWITAQGETDKHYSLLIQYEPSKIIDLEPMKKRAKTKDAGEEGEGHLTRVQPARWCLTNSLLRSRRRSNNGLLALYVDLEDPSRHLFYFTDIADVLEVLRESLKIDLASVGVSLDEEGEMEVNPRLYIIDHEGFLARMRINRTVIGAENLMTWTRMVASQLAVIKLLTKGHGAPL